MMQITLAHYTDYFTEIPWCRSPWHIILTTSLRYHDADHSHAQPDCPPIQPRPARLYPDTGKWQTNPTQALKWRMSSELLW